MLLVQTITLRPQQRRPRETEGLSGQEFGEGAGRVQILRLIQRDVDPQFGEDAGDGPVILQGEYSAQALVAGDNVVERRFQSGQIQRPAQLQSNGDIVKTAVWLQLLEEPETLLGKG